MADVKQCTSCKRLLDQPDDPRSLDCGGDCCQCMAAAGDPDCIKSLRGQEGEHLMANWVQFGKTWKDFKNHGLAQAGTQIEVVECKRWAASRGRAKGEAYLIGDINNNAGVCDDCVAFSKTDIVARYRVVVSPQDLEV